MSFLFSIFVDIIFSANLLRYDRARFFSHATGILGLLKRPDSIVVCRAKLTAGSRRVLLMDVDPKLRTQGSRGSEPVLPEPWRPGPRGGGESPQNGYPQILIAGITVITSRDCNRKLRKHA